MKYCTYLMVYRGNKLPPFYIGFTSIAKIEKGYRGSITSKKYREVWAQEIKDHPELFEMKILSVHDDKFEAKAKETKFQRAMRVHKNDLYLNQCVNGEAFAMPAVMGPEHKAKLSAAHKGKTLSPEHIAKMKASKKGKPKSEEHKAKIRAIRTGIPRSEETKAKMRGKKHSAESLRKMSEAKKGKVRGPYKPRINTQ